MMGHMSDPCFRLASFSDVLVSRNPTTARERREAAGDLPMAGQYQRVDVRVVGMYARKLLRMRLVDRPALEQTDFDAQRNDVPIGHADVHSVERHTDHVTATPIEDGKSLVGVVHFQPLRHVLKGRGELHVRSF